jgi:hypothetical protein
MEEHPTRPKNVANQPGLRKRERRRPDSVRLHHSRTQKPDAQHPSAAGSQEIPDCVTDDVAIFDADTKSFLTGKKKIRLGLSA